MAKIQLNNSFIEWCYKVFLHREAKEKEKRKKIMAKIQLNNSLNDLNNSKFIEWCYKVFLHREADENGFSYFYNLLENQKIHRLDVISSFIESEEHKITKSYEFVYPGHFYSVMPDKQTIQKYLLNGADKNEPLGINFNDKKQIKLLNSFLNFYEEIPFPEEKDNNFRYYFNNSSYSYTDAIFLYSMLRNIMPNKVIEIGSVTTLKHPKNLNKS